MEEAIQKIKHCYEQSKRRTETKPDWRGNVINKGKWDKKRGRPHGIDNKENVALPKRFNALDKA